MDAWAQFVWNGAPETDAHRDGPRSPYAEREAYQTEVSVRRRQPPITEFISQYAIGDSLAASGELLVRSRQLLADSRQQILRCQMRLLLCHSGKTLQ